MSELRTPALRRAESLPDPHEVATITVEHAAHVLGISRAVAYRSVGSGEIPSLRLGRRLVVPTAALAHLLSGAPDRGQQDAAESGHR